MIDVIRIFYRLMEVAVSLSILQLVKILIMSIMCTSAALWAVQCQYQWETGCS